MFGYIRTDDPYLYKKDDTLYNAVYCGLCKSIGRLCGQMARFGLTYDVAFLSVMLHNLADKDVKIEKQHCIARPFRKKNMIVGDEISEAMAAFNVMMCYYKVLDDKNDGGKAGVKSLLFKRGYRRAAKKYPRLAEITRDCYVELDRYEKAKTASVDIAADPFATLARKLSEEVLGEKVTGHTSDAFYFLGKWIYLIDALDDFNDDKKSGNYNVFACMWEDCANGAELVEKHGKEIFPIFNSVFWHLNESLSNITYYFNKDLIENVLLRGIPKKTDEVIRKYSKITEEQ